MNLSSTSRSHFELLLLQWRAFLKGWALDGSLSSAAKEALGLDGNPSLLGNLVSQLGSGDYSALPPIELVPAATMPAAAGGREVYRASNATIYIDANWLPGASRGSVMTQLTEQLGHHLDGLLNHRDTPGDEGKQFAALLTGVAPTSSHQSERLPANVLSSGIANAVALPREQAASLLPEVESSKDPATRPPAPYVPNQLILKFKPGVASHKVTEFQSLFDSIKTQQISLTGAQVWTLSGTVSVEKILSQYGKNPIFEYIEPDYIVTTGATSQATLPNDPNFSQLWGLHNTGQNGGTVDADIDAPEAWDIQKGNPNLVIGVIDTGVDYTHPDLQGNIWTNPGEIAGDGIDNDQNGYIDDVRGWDFAYNDNNPSDVDGHGTHVAGTIAAKGNNGVGVTGVAWNAKIMPLKFLDDTGSGSTSNAILAINYATNKGVKITNNSWGGGGYSQALYDAINAAGQAGSLFIAAAGNSAQNADVSPMYPAAYNLANIISVASTTRTDSLSSFSNYGLTSVDLGAPGSDIYSLAPGGGYATLSGTSMASPHVAGGAALLWSQNPTWTAQQVKTTLMNTGDSIASLAGKTVSGKRLNVFNALAAATLPTVSVTVSPANVQEDGTTNLVYTFTRTNQNISSPLTVNFATSGVANAAPVGSDPADYTVLTNGSVTFNPVTKLGSVTFAAGATTATVEIDPIADTIAEIANETVILTVNSGTGYFAGSPTVATGSIVSEEVLPIFSNPNQITIPASGSSTPYPSTINVSGLSGTINSLKVTLTNLSHTWPDDIDVLLEGPTGAKSLLMSDVGGSITLDSITLTFDPAASSFLPDEGPLNSGSYKPTNVGTDDFFSAPAPVGPYGADFSVFNGTNPNGLWKLYVMDDTGPDAGTIAGGWSMLIGTGTPTPVLPTVSVTVSPANVQEDGTTNLVYTFTRTNLNLSSPLTVNFATSGVANAAPVGSDPADYTVLTNGSVTFNPATKLGSVTFAAGATTATVEIDPIADTIAEIANETVILTVNSGTGYFAGSPAVATGTIVSEEVLPIFSNPNQITIPDSGSSTPYPSTINVSGLSGAINSLKVTLTNLSHTFPDDIDVLLEGPTGAKSLLMSDVGGSSDLNSITLTFDPTASSFLPDQDQLSSGSYKPTNFGTDDFFSAPAPVGPYGADFSVFNGTNPNGLWKLYVMDDAGGDAGTIAGGWSMLIGTDTSTPVVTVVATDADAGEPANNGQFTLTRTGPTASALTVNVAMSGTATNGMDYTAIPATVTFAAGSATALVNLTVIDDLLVEGPETATLTVQTGTGYTPGGPAATINIADNDLPAVTVVATDGDAGEPANNGQFTLTRTGPTASALTVNVAMSGTATNGMDYTAIPATVTFAAGSATALVNLTVIDDLLVEGTETATLTVIAGSGYTPGGLGTITGSSAASRGTVTPSSSATVTINDNDTGSNITVNASDTGWYDNTGFHSPGNANYSAGDATDAAKLYRNWFTFDLPTLSGPIISAQLRLNTYDFSSPTISETYELRDVVTDVATLRAGGSGKTAIYDDLAGGNIYGNRDYTIADKNLFRTIDLNAAAISAITAKSGQAFAIGGWISTLDTIDNYEGVFGFSNGNVGDVQLLLNIGTPLPVVTVNANFSGVSENGTANLIYTFSRTGANTNPLMVNYAVGGTATLGTDYSGITATPATVTFAANSSTATVVVDPKADTTVEANETVVLTLATGIGYTIGTPGPVTTTILNDDGVINQQGTPGKDVIEASGITRFLSGRAGNDILIGYSLAETFIGGAGADEITTGSGYDTVSYGNPSEGADIITDFNVLDDIIQVSASGFGGSLIAGEVIDSSQFLLGTAATTSSHRFIFNQPTGQLFYDADGNGSTMQSLLATLTPGSALTHQNIFAA